MRTALLTQIYRRFLQSRTAVFVIAFVICEFPLSFVENVGRCAPPASPSPSTNVSPLKPGWEQIDSRLVFLTVRLSSDEASLTALNKAIRHTGYEQNAKKDAAHAAADGNSIMDRKAGGPKSWDEFYGKTAEAFFYHPVDANTYYLNPVPIAQRPPQFDYIYKANLDAQKRADGDADALGGKVEELLARRGQIEAEQSALWCEIVLRGLSSQKLAMKPEYRCELRETTSEQNAREQLQEAQCAVKFFRIVDQIQSQTQSSVEKKQSESYAALHDGLVTANQQLVESIEQRQPLFGETDSASPMVKVIACASRLCDVSSNIVDSFALASDGDKNNDPARKATFRASLQDSLSEFGRSVLTLHECTEELLNVWKIHAVSGAPAPAVTIDSAVPVSPTRDATTLAAHGESENEPKVSEPAVSSIDGRTSNEGPAAPSGSDVRSARSGLMNPPDGSDHSSDRPEPPSIPASPLPTGEQADPIVVLTDSTKPYSLNGEYVIPEGKRLMIKGGVTIICSSRSQITAHGPLICDGSSDRPIVFCGAVHKPLWWQGVILDGAVDSTFAGVQISDADIGVHVFRCQPTFEHCIFVNNHRGLSIGQISGYGGGTHAATLNDCVCSFNLDQGILVHGGKVALDACTITRNGGWGVDGAYYVTADIKQSIISLNRGGGISLTVYDSKADVQNSVFGGNSGLDFQSKSKPQSDLRGNYWGPELTRYFQKGGATPPNIKGPASFEEFLPQMPEHCGASISKVGGQSLW